jgi:hypothetical protein
MANKSKAKGTAAESAVVSYLQERELLAVRMPLHGNADRGDIQVFPLPITIEVKNHRAMDLGTWVNEMLAEKTNGKTKLGVVWHKRVGKGNPKDWYCTMTGEDFTTILLQLRKDMSKGDTL